MTHLRCHQWAVTVVAAGAAFAVLAGCTEDGDYASPSASPVPSPSASMSNDPDSEFARLLGMDAHAINTNLPGYIGDPLNGMRVVDGVFSTGEFTLELAAPDATIAIYRTDTFACVEVSAIGPGGEQVTSSYDNAEYWSSNLPDFGMPCGDRYDGIEPEPFVWENRLGLEGWEWLVPIPGTCLDFVTSPYGPIDDREQIPKVVACDAEWDAVLVAKGTLEAGVDPTDDELYGVSSDLCWNDLIDYSESYEVDVDLELSIYYPTTMGYKMGDHTYTCLLERR